MNRSTRSTARRCTVSLLVIFLFSVLLGGHTVNAQSETGTRARKMIGYFSAWSIYEPDPPQTPDARNFHLKDLHTSGTADMLTHINYSFSNVAPETPGGQVKCRMFDTNADYLKGYSAPKSIDGIAVPDLKNNPASPPLRGNLQQLKLLKQIYPDLKIMISLGGWSLSSYFSDMAQTPASRAAFIDSCIDLWLKGNLPEYTDPNNWIADAGGAGVAAGIFDGIDIDWEYPGVCGQPCKEGSLTAATQCSGSHCVYRRNDKANFSSLLYNFRLKLNQLTAQTGKPYLLTIASSANPSDITKLNLPIVRQYVDFINVMTYDLHGAFDARTGFNAGLMPNNADPAKAQKLTVHEALQAYLAGGVPPSKLVMGVPYYGRGWKNVQAGSGSPLYAPVSGSDRAAPGRFEPGIDDYKRLRAKWRAGAYLRYYNTTVKNAYLVNTAKTVFWSFDDVQTMQEKAKYIEQYDLAGVMIWELSGDTVTGELTKALYAELNN